MIWWWHLGRYHDEPYHNWLVARFDQPGEIHLCLNNSRTDRVESCWLVELNATRHATETRRVLLARPALDQYRLNQRLEPDKAFAVLFKHQPLPPAWQDKPLVVGRGNFLPEDAAAEELDLTLPLGRGSRIPIAPETAIEAVRHLLREPPEGAAPSVPVIRLYSSGEANIEIRLEQVMDCDVLLFVGDHPPEVSPGHVVELATLEDAGLIRTAVIDAGICSKTIRSPTQDLVVVPVAFKTHRRSGTLGNSVRFVRVPAVSDIKGDFVDNGELHLRWNWRTNTRVRVLVRCDHPQHGGPRVDLSEHTTANEYADRNYFLVAREWLDSAIDAESCTKLQVTIESLHHDDTGGIGPTLATRSIELSIPKRRLQR